MSAKRGRARVYPRSSGYECTNGEIDEYVALTGELTERVVDQTDDLPPDALSSRPKGVGFSTAKLALHMAESEQSQLLLVAEPDAELNGRSPFATPREAVKHMHRHWTYHSGQIDILRLQWGDDYVWTLKHEQR